MLSPQDRLKAVELLAKKQAANFRNDYNNILLEGLMRSGFKGYSTFTDQQLVNGINSFAKNGDYECQSFLTAITVERFVLE